MPRLFIARVGLSEIVSQLIILQEVLAWTVFQWKSNFKNVLPELSAVIDLGIERDTLK